MKLYYFSFPLMLIVILVISGCATQGSYNEPPNKPLIIQDFPKVEDKCVSVNSPKSIVIQVGSDIDLCYQTNYLKVAAARNDTKICDGISTPYYLGVCYAAVAQQKRDYNICNFIEDTGYDNPNSRDACYSTYAATASYTVSNDDICTKIKNEQLKGYCKEILKVATLKTDCRFDLNYEMVVDATALEYASLDGAELNFLGNNMTNVNNQGFCHKGGLIVGENTKNFYCYIGTLCYPKTENDVFSGWEASLTRAEYKILSSVISPVADTASKASKKLGSELARAFVDGETNKDGHEKLTLQLTGCKTNSVIEHTFDDCNIASRGLIG